MVSQEDTKPSKSFVEKLNDGLSVRIIFVRS